MKQQETRTYVSRKEIKFSSNGSHKEKLPYSVRNKKKRK